MHLAQLFRSLFARNRAVRKTPSRSFRPQLECLTERIMPAVTANVVAGVLIVKPDPSTNADIDQLTVTPVAGFAGRFNVKNLSSFMNNTFTGTYDAVGVTSMKFDLGDGDDSLEADNLILAGGISFVGGNGANTLNLDNCVIGGSISVTNLTNASGDDNTFIMHSKINGSVSVSNGLGSSGANFSDSILGSLKYSTLSSALIPGENEVFLARLSVGGSIALALGNGDNNVFTPNSSDPIEVGGSFSYSGGSGIDKIQVSCGMTVGAAASFILGDNNNIFTFSDAKGLFVGTKVAVSAGAGNDSITLNATEASRIYGAASFNLGNGTNTFSTTGLRVGSLALTTGTGDDTATIDNLTVAAGFAFLGGNGANTFSINHSTIGGSLTVTNLTNTTGQDSTTLKNSTVNGSVKVNHGLGNALGHFQEVAILGSLGYTTTSSALVPGDDEIKVLGVHGLNVGGNIGLALGDGFNLFEPNAPIEAGGSFTYTGGGGSDSISLYREVTFGAAATISLGEGENVFRDVSNLGMFVGTNLTVTAGAGGDAIFMSTALASRIKGAATFKLGNGNNDFDAINLRVGALTLVTGSGNDTGTLDNLTVVGAAALNFGAGTNTIKLASTSVGTASSTIGGAFSLATGTGVDSILVGFHDFFRVGGAAKFTLGTIALGNGSDDLTINAATFASALSIVCGSGSDALHIGDTFSVSIGGKLFVNGDAGNDQLFLGTFGDPLKVVRLLFAPTLIGGAGGDSVRIFPQILGGNVQGPPGVVVLPTPAALLAAGWEGIV